MSNIGARQRLLLALALLAACSSPNRGWWGGTFEGGVSGDMRFSINTRGTKASGSIEGTTSDGQDFRATFEGSLNQDYLRADIEGSSSTGTGLPAAFAGEMKGTLGVGQGDGTWQVELVHLRAGYEGVWTALQE
jgi:hypothetical protein